MAEPALSIDYNLLQREFSRFRGISESTADWAAIDANLTQQFADILATGLNRFYYPDLGPDEPNHEWSFLRVNGTHSVTSGDVDYTMPDDFSGVILEDSVTFGSGINERTLQRIDEATWRSLRSKDSASGDPKYFAIRPVTHVAATGFRWEMLLYPTPNASRTLTYSYRIVPDSLSTTNLYPYGGAAHSNTILYAVLAEAERVFDEDPNGPWNQRFRQELLKSIRLDRQVKTSQFDSLSAFPISNVETDRMAVDYFELQRRVGEMLGYGLNPAIYNTPQAQKVDETINQGYRNVLYPDPLDQSAQSHEWTFLCPVQEMQTVSGQRKYPLPEDFERFLGDITFDPQSSSIYGAIKVTSSERLRSMDTNSTGYPVWAAVEWLKGDGSAEQARQVVFEPTPSGAYTLIYQYHAIQRRLSADHPYPAGGATMGEVVLCACLAEAERRKTGKSGEWHSRYISKLATAVSTDLRRAPHYLGLYGRGYYPALGRSWYRRSGLLYGNPVLYNGTSYTG